MSRHNWLGEFLAFAAGAMLGILFMLVVALSDGTPAYDTSHNCSVEFSSSTHNDSDGVYHHKSWTTFHGVCSDGVYRSRIGDN